MATQITREGGLLKVKVGANRPKYFCLANIQIRVDGDFVEFMDGNNVDFNDVTVPTISSAENLADIIGDYVYLYNTGQ